MVTLKKNEKVKLSFKLHWSALYIAIANTISYMFLALLAAVIALSFKTTYIPMYVLLFLAPVPMVIGYYRWKKTECLITNSRIVIAQGLIARGEKEIPVNKIQDITVSQGIIDRMFGTGTIRIMTGNDSSFVLSNIDNVMKVKTELSEVVGR